MRFIVYGSAQPAGSKRGFAFRRKGGGTGVAIADANPKSGEWKKVVAQAVRDQYDGPLLEGPLAVTITIFRVRPKGHTGKRGLKASAPEYPTGRPDLLKLARGVEDSLTGVLWADDAQIVDEILAKRWADHGQPACVSIEVRTLELPHGCGLGGGTGNATLTAAASAAAPATASATASAAATQR